MHIAQRLIVERAPSEGRHEPEPFPALVEFLLSPVYPVARERLDLLTPTPARAVHQRGLLTRGQGRHPADVPAAGDFAGEFHRAEDVRPAGRVHVPVGRRGGAQRTPDPPAIEEVRARPVEAPKIALAAKPEIEDRRALDKERPLFAELCLDIAEIDHRGIDFDLAEVRIRRHRERQVRPEAQPGVRSEARIDLRAVVERVELRMWGECRPGRRVGHQLDATRRRDALDAHQVREAGNESGAVLRRVDEVVELVLPCDVTPKVDAPDILALSHEPQLGVGDPHLRRPAGGVTGDFGFPHTVPAVVVPLVVEQRTIVQSAGGRHAEVEPAPLVVIGIDEHLEPIRIRALIAAGEPGDD